MFQEGRGRPQVAIAAGGTGGHIFPGLAVAEELSRRGFQTLWFGTSRGLEARIVPERGFPFIELPMEGVRGRGLSGWLRAPLLLKRSFLKACRILREHRVGSVLCMGGFISLPVGLAAALLGLPLLVHEQNRIPGSANRLLSRLADHVLTGFPQTPLPGAEWIGNPLRMALLAAAQERRRRLPHPPFRILVIGGSQGARVFNERLPGLLAPFREEVEIWHLSGKQGAEAVAARYASLGLRARVSPFLQEMAEAYPWADLAIARAGAMTLSELAAFGIGAILVPFPFAVDDHQTANARYAASEGAALLLPQSELAGLPELLRPLLSEPLRLAEMGERARQLARIDATERLVDHLLSRIQERARCLS